MSVVVPVVLILIIMAGVGAHITNYAGQTPYEAWDTMRTTHDYTCSQSQFDELYEQWHDIKYANRPITQQDIQKVLGYVDNLYNGTIEYCENWIDYLTGSFDNTWTADYSSRMIKVYDEDTGELLGSFGIYGCVDVGGYDGDIPPTLVEPSRNNALCFVTVSSSGTHYSTNVYFNTTYQSMTSVDSSGFNPVGYPPFWFQFTDSQASNIAFMPSPNYQGRYILKGVFDGVTSYNIDGLLVGNPLITGRSDVDVTIPFIGTATTDNGDVVGVRPDGSIVLPDGSIVYPNTQTGEYPYPINEVNLGDDFWVKLSELIAQTQTTGESTTATNEATLLNLEGIRSAIINLSDYIKNGFWADFKTNMENIFSIDTTKYNIQQENIYTLLNNYITKIMGAFGLNTGGT